MNADCEHNIPLFTFDVILPPSAARRFVPFSDAASETFANVPDWNHNKFAATPTVTVPVVVIRSLYMHFSTPRSNSFLATTQAHLYEQNQSTYVDYHLAD